MGKYYKKKNKINGFTLVELMVASSIFAIVMLTLIGALLITFGTAKNSRALRTAMDNVSFSVESMTRSIRMGENYSCRDSGGINIENITPQDCPEGGTLLVFTPQEQEESPGGNNNVGYQLVTIRETDTSPSYGTIMRYDSKNTKGVPITAPNVNIERLYFIVKGSSPDDEIQGSVYITMKGSITVKGVVNSFTLQTLASQRNF